MKAVMMDNKLMLRIQMLHRDSLEMVWAYHHAPTDRFLFLHDEDYGTPPFDAGMRDARAKGAQLVAVVAWMKQATPDGQPLFEFEALPEGSAEIAQRARDAFRQIAIEAGIQADVLTMQSSQS